MQIVNRGNWSLIILLALAGFISCNTEHNESRLETFVHTNGEVLLDTTGKPLMLHGLNLMNKNSTDHWDGINKATFDSIKNWGMNCVRLGIFWDGLEPQPNKIDTNYFHHLDSCLVWAKEDGIYVLLDMHQDLYSQKYNGDGAPGWACLDEGRPNTVAGGSWDDAYFTSPAIQTSFDNFWKNKKASDSIGIQDHLINVWKTVATRYANNPVVIGYDLMNEPFIGSQIDKVQQTYFKVLLDTLKNNKSFHISNEQALMQLWMSPEGRAKIMKMLDDTTLFKEIMDATEPIYAAFEEKYLQPFYEKTFAAIQSVDTNHLLFLEPSVSANIGVKSHLKNTFGKYMVYAPHTYDIVTDTKDQAAYSIPRLTLILDRHQQKRQQLNVPMAMGEWGAFYNADSSIIPEAEFILHTMDSLKCGSMYWAYQKDLRKRSYFQVLYRQ